MARPSSALTGSYKTKMWVPGSWCYDGPDFVIGQILLLEMEAV